LQNGNEPTPVINNDECGVTFRFALSPEETLINVNEAAKPKAKIGEKAQFMGDKCAF